MAAAATAKKTQPLSAEMRRAIAREARAEQCRRSLYHFVRHSFNVLEPGTAFEDNWHIKVFCDHIQWMLEGWLVAHGRGTPAMVERQKQFWAWHGLHFQARALLVQNLILNLPPVTLKSRILMVCAPAWIWLHAPSFSVSCISSVEDNVKRDSHLHRQLVESDWYRENFLRQSDGTLKWQIMSHIDAVGEWKTTAGGERKSRTMLGNWTGSHTDAIFLDDPDDAHKVHSAPKRLDVQWKWRRAIKNRVNHLDLSIRIAIQQRVHVDDWTASQVARRVWSPDDRKAWAWVVIPLMFGKAPSDAPTVSPWGWSDPRKVANDNLQPTRFSPEFIADEMIDKGVEGFEGQYNQNPQSFDNGMFKRQHARFFRIENEPITRRQRPLGCGLREDGEDEPTFVLKYLPDSDVLDLEFFTITVDCSNGSDRLTASNVGILAIGGKQQMRFVFDDRSDVMRIERMYDEVESIIADWPVGRVLIELKAAGPSVIAEMNKRIREGRIKDKDGRAKIVVVEAINVPNETKEGRAVAMVPAWQQGLIFVLEGANWIYPRITSDGRVLDEGFLGEVCTFPQSKKTDRIDALSQLISYYRDRFGAREKAKAFQRLRNML